MGVRRGKDLPTVSPGPERQQRNGVQSDSCHRPVINSGLPDDDGFGTILLRKCLRPRWRDIPCGFMPATLRTRVSPRTARPASEALVTRLNSSARRTVMSTSCETIEFLRLSDVPAANIFSCHPEWLCHSHRL